VDPCGSELGPVTRCFEHDSCNGPLGSIKDAGQLLASLQVFCCVELISWLKLNFLASQ
jgi:hypothetical protein